MLPVTFNGTPVALTEGEGLVSETTDVPKDDGPAYRLLDHRGVVVGRADEPLTLVHMAVGLQTPLRIQFLGEGCTVYTNRRRGETRRAQKRRLLQEVRDAVQARWLELEAYRRRMLETYG